MKISTERILTTHTGSLPRPASLSATSLVDPTQAPPTPDQIEEAVRQTVQAQRRSGVDVVNDGEVSKPGYSTYVTSRLEGFGGRSEMGVPKEYEDFPEWAASVSAFSDPAVADVLNGPACIGPVSYRDRAPLDADIANLRAATDGSGATDVFMSAASPGVISVFLGNQYYPSEEDYIAPEQMRMHLCWGNYEGPHHHDVPLAEIIGPVLQARPAAISFEGANPRHEHEWKVFEDVRLPDGKVLIPGVLDSTTNYIEHLATPTWSVGRTCWPAATAASPPSPPS